MKSYFNYIFDTFTKENLSNYMFGKRYFKNIDKDGNITKYITDEERINYILSRHTKIKNFIQKLKSKFGDNNVNYVNLYYIFEAYMSFPILKLDVSDDYIKNNPEKFIVWFSTMMIYISYILYFTNLITWDKNVISYVNNKFVINFYGLDENNQTFGQGIKFIQQFNNKDIFQSMLLFKDSMNKINNDKEGDGPGSTSIYIEYDDRYNFEDDNLFIDTFNINNSTNCLKTGKIEDIYNNKYYRMINRSPKIATQTEIEEINKKLGK